VITASERRRRGRDVDARGDAQADDDRRGKCITDGSFHFSICLSRFGGRTVPVYAYIYGDMYERYRERLLSLANMLLFHASAS
jgi:hypothetical protein